MALVVLLQGIILVGTVLRLPEMIATVRLADQHLPLLAVCLPCSGAAGWVWVRGWQRRPVALLAVGLGFSLLGPALAHTPAGLICSLIGWAAASAMLLCATRTPRWPLLAGLGGGCAVILVPILHLLNMPYAIQMETAAAILLLLVWFVVQPPPFSPKRSNIDRERKTTHLVLITIAQQRFSYDPLS